MTGRVSLDLGCAGSGVDFAAGAESAAALPRFAAGTLLAGVDGGGGPGVGAAGAGSAGRGGGHRGWGQLLPAVDAATMAAAQRAMVSAAALMRSKGQIRCSATSASSTSSAGSSGARHAAKMADVTDPPACMHSSAHSSSRNNENSACCSTATSRVHLAAHPAACFKLRPVRRNGLQNEVESKHPEGHA